MYRRFLQLLSITALMLTACSPNIHFVKLEKQHELLHEGLDADTSVLALIKPYKNKIGDEMRSVIGTVANELIKAKPESTMTNWVADLTHQQCEAYTNMKLDFALLNYGGLRIPSIPAGALTKGKIFELMPFENYLVVVEMTGNELKSLFNHAASKGGWPVSKHIKMVIQGNRAVDVRIKNKKVDAKQLYRFATIDYIANGGDNCSFLKDKKQYATGILFRDAIIEHAEATTKAEKQINAQVDERVFILK